MIHLRFSGRERKRARARWLIASFYRDCSSRGEYLLLFVCDCRKETCHRKCVLIQPKNQRVELVCVWLTTQVTRFHTTPKRAPHAFVDTLRPAALLFIAHVRAVVVMTRSHTHTHTRNFVERARITTGNINSFSCTFNILPLI